MTDALADDSAIAAAPFADDAEHLAAELAVLDLVLLREAVRARRAAGHNPDERGLYVSDEELELLLSRPFAAPLWHSVPRDGALADLDAALDHHAAALAARLRATAAAGRTLLLEHLVATHQPLLDRAETEDPPDRDASRAPPDDTTEPPHDDTASAPPGDAASAPHDDTASAPHDDAVDAPARARASAPHGDAASAPSPAPRLPLKPLLLLALAPELDLRYERILGWLHDDITRRLPSVQLALDLLAPGPTARLALLPVFAARGPLRRLALIHTQAPQPGAGLLRHELRLAPGLAAWLAGQPSIPPGPAVRRVAPPPAATCPPGQPAPGDFSTCPPGQPIPAHLYAAAARGQLVLNLHGPDGAGRRRLAVALAAAAGRPLYLVDGARCEALSDDDHADLLACLARAARLERAAVCFADFDRQRPAALERLADVALLVLVTHRPWHPPQPPRWLAALVEHHVPHPDLAAREALWRAALPDLPPAAARAAADGFRFTPRQIHAAAVTARGLALAHAGAPTLTDVLLACRRHATPKLGALAAPVTTRRRWHDLVLPDEPQAQLREIVRRLQQRARVLDEWGFGTVAGAGVAALFAGGPGTGKTMAAAIVAGECARDLYRIDLSQVVSKYIGETEKHLETLFAEAEASDAALFFDEADAIFGKRGAIRDAHDRFANIEVGFLLQRIESFPGLVILATNLRKNIDAAFLRRLQVIVEFPSPDLESRARIWAGTWPPGAPVAADVDPGLLARRFDLSGGHIRNIALTAAYAAAEAGTAITLHHVLGAARVEYRKLDKLMPEAAFAAP